MNKRQEPVSGFIVSCVVILSRCTGNRPAKETDLRGEQYASQASCATCHQAVYDAYLETAHFNTSAEAGAQTVKGSFTAPGNSYHCTGDKVVVMEKRDGGLFQASTKKGMLKEAHRCHMPALPSNAFTLLTNGAANPTPDFIRTHLITFYPEETKRIIAMLKGQ